MTEPPSSPHHPNQSPLFEPSAAVQSQLTEMLATEAVEDKLSPGVAVLVALLQRRGCAVYLVSGGFRQMIEPIAAVRAA